MSRQKSVNNCLDPTKSERRIVNMAPWKKEVRRIARDLYIPDSVYHNIIIEVQAQGNISQYYKTPEDCLYDRAIRKIKAYAFNMFGGNK